MPDDVLQEIMEALNKQPPAPRRTAPPPRAHAPARESIFRLMIKKDSAKDLHEVPLYMAGILKDEATCVIYQTDLCPTTRLEFLYRMSRQHLMPPGTLVQIMQPRGTIYDMEADGVLYFSPADGYSQMGQFGRIAEGYHWMAPAPAILLKWGLDPWPCLSPRQEPAPKPPKPVPQPPDEREQLRERLSGNEDAKRLLDFLEGHAVPPAPGNDEKDPGELTMGLNDKTLQDLYEYNRGLYTAEVQRELKDVIKKLSALTTRQKRRVCDLLRYAYNHKQTYTPIPAVELQRALQQTLPGQADVTDRVMAMVRAANARRQPLTLLVLDEEEETGKAIARCLQTVLPGAASLDGNLGALNLAGSEAAYDSAMMGMAVKKMEGPLLCIEAFNAIVWQAEVNKDSAAPAFTALLGSRTFTDRFLGVAIRYGGHIVALAPALELKYRQMFSQVLEVPVRTRAETVHLLQAKAQHGQPAFALSATAAERLLVAYAPGSLRRRAVPGSNGGLCRCAGPPGGGKRPGRRAGAAFADPRRAVGARLGGAPGTGKTALARATAKASGRALVRVDMAALTREQLTGRPALYGGTGKESVLIRRIIRGGRSALILLDEIDKARPDVMECLLELFENKRLFADAFLGRVDLSQHLIVLSGNEPDRISRPLLDRCQVIGMHPYTPGEKAALLRVKWHAALAAEQLPDQPLSGELVRWVVQRCASGGAQDIETACTCLVRQVAAGHGLPRNEADLQRLLGGGAPEPPVIREPGTVYCLSVLADGGGQVNPLMVRENLAPGAPRLKTLGLGTDLAIQESAEMAATWAANTLPLPLPPLVIAMDASTKSGPSAGAAMALACYSLLTGRVLTGVAATGELLLDGTVLPVGGIPSKLIGVLRCARRVRTLFLPAANRFEVTPRLLAELAAAGVTLHFIGRMQDAIQILEAGKKDREQ